MSYNEEIEDFFYIETYKMKKIFFIIAVGMILALLKLDMDLGLIEIVRRVLVVIVGLAFVVLTMASNAYSINKFFTYLAVSFFLVALDSFAGLLFTKNFFIVNLDIINWINGSTIISEGIITAMLYCIIDLTEYAYNPIKGEQKYWIVISIIAILIGFFVKEDITLIIGSVIFYLILLGVNILTLVSFKKYETVYEYKINYIKIFFYLHFSVVTISLILLFYSNITVLYVIKAILSMLGTIMLFGCLLSKLLYSPYKILFNDLYMRNEELNELNLQVIMKNKELEISQKLLKDRESIFKKLFNDIPIPMVIVNGKNNRIIFANPEFLNKIDNPKLRDIINKNFSNIVKVEEAQGEFKIASMRNKVYYEGRIELNNKIIYLQFTGIKENKEKDEYIINFNDITDKKNNEIMQEQIEQKKIEEKLRNDFLSNISHDLKTPVNVIYSASQLNKLYMENKDMESLKKYNIISKQNCLTLMRLTNNLIDSSKISSDYLKPQMKKNNIVEMVENVVMYLGDYAKLKKINLVFDTDEEEIIVISDEEFIERIILNLLSNALKYTKADGNIWVNIKVNNNKVRVTVEDDGLGMDEEFLKSAFSRYSTGKNNELVTEKGTGIGLYVVRNLVEMQKGTISIESQLNKGTKIVLEFMRENLNEQENNK